MDRQNTLLTTLATEAGAVEDAGLLRAFVKAIKQQESEHDISLTSLDNSELFEQFCKPIIEHFCEFETSKEILRPNTSHFF